MSGLPMDGIPDEYKVKAATLPQTEGLKEPHNLTSFREQYEQRIAQLEKRTAQLEQPGVNWLYETKQDYNGYVIVRDLEYTFFRIFDTNGKEVPGLSDSQFRSFTKAKERVDGHIALQKALNNLNGKTSH